MSSIKIEKCRLYREFDYNRADFSSVYCRGSIVKVGFRKKHLKTMKSKYESWLVFLKVQNKPVALG